jgi:DNA repair protein RecO (recombination protein O)
MTALKDQAVCIRSRSYSESSQIVTLFARSHGKLQAIAKGSRRTKGSFRGGIELLCPAEIVFRPARAEATLATMQSFDPLQTTSHLRSNLIGLHCAQLAADLLDQFTEEMDPHEDLYDAFLHTIERFGIESRNDIVLLKFELILLRQAGFEPVWRHCCQCMRALSDGQKKYYFSSRRSGMICRDCEPGVAEKRFMTSQALRVLQNESFDDATPPQITMEAQELLHYHQREILGKQTKTMVFVNQLLQKHLITGH